MKVIEYQFGAFGCRPWFIEGTLGMCFIKKDWEAHPFISKYYLPLCPKVGHLFTWMHTDTGWAAEAGAPVNRPLCVPKASLAT